MKSPFITSPLKSTAKNVDGGLRMAIAVAGQSAFDMFGEEAILTEEFLRKDYATWNGGKVSINHENNNHLINKATITDVEYDPETKLVWATFRDLPEKTIDLINSDFFEGLSQECIPLEMEGNKVTKGYGIGATIVTYPYKPAATPEMGVGVRPTASMLAAISSKYPEYNQGGKKTSDEDLKNKIKELESTVADLKSKNEKLAAENEALTKQVSEFPAQVKAAVSSALEADRAKQEAKTEYNRAVEELGSIMGEEALKDLLSSKPTVEVIQATAAAMKSTIASHIGTGVGGGASGSGKAASVYESGKNIYEAAGLSIEDLEKYGGIE